MRTGAWPVSGASAILYAFAVLYAIWRDVAMGRVDWVGVALLGLGGTFCAALGVYFAAAARRVDPRPDDDPDVQKLSPPGHWPVGVGAAAAALGLTHQSVWLIAVGVVAILAAGSRPLLDVRTGAGVAEPQPVRPSPQRPTPPPGFA